MEQSIEVPFSAQEGSSAVSQNSQERLTNMFAEIEVSGRRKLIRRQRRALARKTTQAGEKRCIEKNAGVHYAVIGATLYSYDGSTLTSLGTLDTSTGRCTMIFDDAGNIAISDGATLYYWNGSALSKPTTQSTVDTLAFLSGYAIYNEPDTATFWVSAVSDFTSWDALDFATAESKTDNLVRVFASNGQVWMFGEVSIEVWDLISGADFPFARYVGADIDRGLMAKWAVAAEDNTIFFLGNDGVVYRMEGRPVRISTHPVERLISNLSDAVKATAEMFVYTDEGHKFVTLTFPGYLTLQYNIATGFWNRCKTYEQDDWDIVGPTGGHSDYYLTTGGVCALERDLNKDEGVVMERGGISAPISDRDRRIVLRMLSLDCEVGNVAEGLDAPTVMLRVSRNGETFGNETWRGKELGETGEYRKRVVWRNLGMGRKFMIEVNFTDDAEFSILGADAVVR